MYSVTGWHFKMTWCVVQKILMRSFRKSSRIRFEFLYKIREKNKNKGLHLGARLLLLLYFSSLMSRDSSHQKVFFFLVYT